MAGLHTVVGGTWLSGCCTGITASDDGEASFHLPLVMFYILPPAKCVLISSY